MVKKCKKFIQLSFEFIKKGKRQSWRERLIASFEHDPLFCPQCKQEMKLWRLWHPDYGDIYDFCRDAPKYKENSEESKVKEEVESPQWRGQLCLSTVE